MIFRPSACHRMDGSAHWGILWHENTGFCGKTGRRMKNQATFFILWQENESGGEGELGKLYLERDVWKELLFRSGWSWGAGVRELAEPKKFSPIQAAGGSVEGPPRLPEENFLDGSSSGRDGDEFISGQNKLLLKSVRPLATPLSRQLLAEPGAGVAELGTGAAL